ncbi:glycosyl transferase family 4 family protein [Asticcacaulis sp. MM231]|uniref:glycosyltransferase family 4 protein n=1 Tax=Asticcacaulis sp. MM231 TaxID=3157666 RepID=UPI0032D57A0E
MSDWHMTWLIPPGLLLGALVTSALASAAFSLLVLKGGPIDIPRERGAHLSPTPTSGGLAIMAASALVIGLVIWLYGPVIPGNWRDGLILFGFASLMGICGAVDDVIDLPAKWRLGFQVVLCLIFAWYYRVTEIDFGPGLEFDVWWPFGLLGSAAWLILTINTINFMDGANGLAVGTQTIALLIMAGLIVLMAPLNLYGAYVGGVLLVCVCVAGAHIGFAPFNLPPGQPQQARAFQGDAGSMFSGALIGGSILVVKAYGIGSVWFGGYLLAPLLVDVVLTLIVRTRKKQNILKPHKEHLYQIWLQRRDGSHLKLAIIVWSLCLFSSLVGLGARMIDRLYQTDLRFLVLVVLISAYSYGWVRLRGSLLKRPLLSAKP